MVRSRGRGVELAHAKGMACGNYHKHLQVQHFPARRFKRTTRRLFCTESLFSEVPGPALRINTISPILRPPQETKQPPQNQNSPYLLATLSNSTAQAIEITLLLIIELYSLLLLLVLFIVRVLVRGLDSTMTDSSGSGLDVEMDPTARSRGGAPPVTPAPPVDLSVKDTQTIRLV
jgi:hypothetical protein